MRIVKFIKGEPYSKSKPRGNTEGTQKWSQSIVDQTRDLERVRGPCKLDVEFVLPRNRSPTNFPFANDLDNLLKRLLDALGVTVLSDADGGDSSIVELHATKRLAEEGEETGATLLITDEPWKWALETSRRIRSTAGLTPPTS